jgi:hypothetical protein
MAYARVVSFEDVDQERIDGLRSRIESEGGPPPDVPAREILVLHDPDARRSLAILFFENEDDYRRGDAALSAMPADDTPGRRASVARYEVALRKSM